MKNKISMRIGTWNTPPCIRKFLTSLKALTLLLVMLMSVNVWGAEGDKHTLYDATLTWVTSYNQYSSTVQRDATVGACWEYASNNTKGWAYLRMCPGKNKTNTSHIGTVAATTVKTKSIDVTIVAKASTTINSAKLYVYGGYSSTATSYANVYSTQKDVVTINTSDIKAGTLNITPSTGTSWDSGVYFVLEINLTNGNNNNGIDVSKFVVTEAYSGTPSGKDVTITAESELNLTAEQSDGTITVTYGDDVADKEVNLFSDASCTTPFSGDWFYAELNSTIGNIDYIAEANTGAAREAYIQIYVIADDAETENTKVIKVTQAKYAAPTGTFVKYTGDLVEGDYVICDGTDAMKNSVTSNRLDYAGVTVSSDEISNPDASVIWHIAPAAEGNWSIFNTAYDSNKGGYAAGTGTKNQAGILAATTDVSTETKAQWTCATVTNGYNFENVANKAAGVNSKLQKNGTYGFACYSAYSNITLYKKKAEGNVPVTGVSLPATATIKTGGTQQLTPTFAPFDATNKNVTWEVIDGSAYIEISDAGLVTAKAEGEGTVRVTTEDGGFTATCVVTVVNGIANTKETAYTVAQALALYDAGFDLDATVYVKGVITSITGTNKNNIYIKDAGQSNSFEFYGLVDGDATVSSLTQYDTIIGHGQLDKFNATYEFKSGCVLDERKAYVAPTILIDPSNTPETAYTPAKAIEIYDNGAQYDLTKPVYVKGVVTTKPSLNTSGTWQGSYYQVEVAAAETETPTFVFFHMFAGAESAQFAEDIVKANDTLIAYGTLTKYNTTYELAERCYMYERKPYQAQVTGVTIDNKEGLTVVANESITLTATIADEGAIGTLVWSVINGDTYASIDQTGKVTGRAAGEATIQVQVEGTEFTDQCTVTVTAAYEGATLPYSFDDGKNSTDPAFKQTGLGSDYSASPKLKFDGAEDEVVFHIAEAPAYMSFDIKGNGSPWAGRFDVLESADNSSYTSVASYTELASDKASLNVLLKGTSRYIKFVYTTKTDGNVALGKVNILATAPKTDPEFTIANVDVVVEDMAALQITTNSDGAVTYTIDPDNEGIEIDGDVVYAYTEGTYTVTANKAETETYNAAQTTFTVSVSSVAYKTAEVSTFTAIDGGLLELGQFHSYKGDAGTAPAVNNGQIRLYQGGGYITISALPGLKIAKIDITSAMATSYNYKVDAAEDYTLVDDASLAQNATANIAGLTADSVRIYCLGTDKNSRFYVSYLKVYYTGELETVTNLEVAGAEVTEYEIGETVDHTGAVVIAEFATASYVDVTLNSTFVDPDMSTSGTKQVTAKFAESEATYSISVKAETPEITVDATEVGFGTILKDDVVDAKTAAVTLKAIAEATVEVSGEGKDAFNVTPTSLTESGNITITPITTAAGEFTATITISADGAESKTIALSMTVSDGDLDKETVDFTEVYSDVTGSSSVEFAGYNGITFSLAVAKNDGTQPKYYANGSSVRAYAKNTITISSEKTIAFILINHTGKSYQDVEAMVDNGTLKVNEAYSMWTLGATSGTITLANTVRFDNITVYYEYDEVVRSAQSENQIGTGCQTLDIVAVKGATLYQVNYTYGCYLEFMEVTYPVKAGMPIIMQADNTNDGKIEVIYGQKSPVATEGLDKDGLYGYIGAGQFEIPNDEGYYVFKGGMLRPALDNYTTSGHAYIKLGEVPTEDQQTASSAPRRRMSMGIERNTPTSMEEIFNAASQDGKFIINGQLFIFRDGKVFNAQGSLIK